MRPSSKLAENLSSALKALEVSWRSDILLSRDVVIYNSESFTRHYHARRSEAGGPLPRRSRSSRLSRAPAMQSGRFLSAPLPSRHDSLSRELPAERSREWSLPACRVSQHVGRKERDDPRRSPLPARPFSDLPRGGSRGGGGGGRGNRWEYSPGWASDLNRESSATSRNPFFRFLPSLARPSRPSPSDLRRLGPRVAAVNFSEHRATTAATVRGSAFHAGTTAERCRREANRNPPTDPPPSFTVPSRARDSLRSGLSGLRTDSAIPPEPLRSLRQRRARGMKVEIRRSGLRACALDLAQIYGASFGYAIFMYFNKQIPATFHCNM